MLARDFVLKFTVALIHLAFIQRSFLSHYQECVSWSKLVSHQPFLCDSDFFRVILGHVTVNASLRDLVLLLFGERHVAVTFVKGFHG